MRTRGAASGPAASWQSVGRRDGRHYSAPFAAHETHVGPRFRPSSSVNEGWNRAANLSICSDLVRRDTEGRGETRRHIAIARNVRRAAIRPAKTPPTRTSHAISDVLIDQSLPSFAPEPRRPRRRSDEPVPAESEHPAGALSERRRAVSFASKTFKADRRARRR